MGGQVEARKGTWAAGHTQLLERVCKGKLMEKSLEDCLEGATASGCGSGIDVGEQARQAGRRAKHRVEGSKDKLKFSDTSSSNSHQEIAKTSWCPPTALHVPTSQPI